MTCRWFHLNIDGKQAERLLMDKGQDGSFLARPSKTEGYSLSVRNGGEVYHIKIQNNGDLYLLGGRDTFASLSELVDHYMKDEDQLKEKSGAAVKLKHPLASVDPTSERWFHGHLTGRDAEELLIEKGRNSSFLVRKSQSRPGNFVLSVKCDDKVTHYKIWDQNGKFDIGGGQQFPSLSELVGYYQENPMVEKTGNVAHFKHPLYNSRMVAGTLNQRIEQLQAEDDNSKLANASSGQKGFWGEFNELQQSEFTGPRYSRDYGSKPGNKSKNRYKNILPYDSTRIVLSDGKEETGSDYINANMVAWTDDDPTMVDTKRKYIATQGPLNATMADFYRMIWQEGSRVIVNLAKITERGKVQLHVYWPTPEDKEKLYVFEEGSYQFRITLLEETGDEDFTLRDMKLSKEDTNGKPLEEPRQLFQFHYTGWPDYNVPENPGPMIDLLERINSQMDSLASPGPMVVHCSAGIGRTGTLIVADMIIDQIKTSGLDSDIDIFKTILMVRGQRSGLVQTQSQYQFVYLAVQRFMEIEEQRQVAGQDLGGAEYTNIEYANQAVQAVKRASQRKDDQSKNAAKK